MTKKVHDNINFEAMWQHNANSEFNCFQNNDGLFIYGYIITSMNIVSQIVTAKTRLSHLKPLRGEVLLVWASDADIKIK